MKARNYRTHLAVEALNRNVMVISKGLVGYMTTARGHKLAFALYLNNVSLPAGGGLESIETTVGQTLGEIASIAYQTM